MPADPPVKHGHAGAAPGWQASAGLHERALLHKERRRLAAYSLPPDRQLFRCISKRAAGSRRMLAPCCTWRRWLEGKMTPPR